MPTLDWACDRTDGVTFVELRVTGETGQRVRVESTLEPVWPPRRQGQPAAGWAGTSFEGEIEDGSLVVGYASPAEPSDPPAELQEVSTAEETIDPGDVVRALGPGTPPRDAVPREVGSVADEESGQPKQIASAGGQMEQTATTEQQNHQTASSPEPPDSNEPTPGLPPAVEAYFTAIEQRLVAAEQLSNSETVKQAREAVCSAGGMGAVDGLDEQLQADRARLERLGERQRALTKRLSRTEIPVTHLERLA
jgi:hypothetical protein